MTSLLEARLAALLPGLDEAMRARVAAALATAMHGLVLDSWAELLRLCASRLPPGRAAALGAPALSGPGTEMLAAGLAASAGGIVTPAILLALPMADAGGLAASLLTHGQVCVREAALDALADPAFGAAALRDACAAWSRHRLLAEIVGVETLTHGERLGLQDALLQAGPAPPVPLPEPRTLAPCRKAGCDEGKSAASGSEIMELLPARAQSPRI